MKTIIIWYRNDLRVHDHPALTVAAQNAQTIIPVFILDAQLLTGERSSSNRNRFLLECLKDLQQSLQALGSDLVIRSGEPAKVLPILARETKAEAVYYSADYTPFAIARDKHLKIQLEQQSLEFRGFPGRLAVSGLDNLHTKAGTAHKVFHLLYKIGC